MQSGHQLILTANVQVALHAVETFGTGTQVANSPTRLIQLNRFLVDTNTIGGAGRQLDLHNDAFRNCVTAIGYADLIRRCGSGV